MSTQANQVPAEQPAIKPIGDIAPVVTSGIQNKQNVATAQMVETYCAQVIAGKPTGKIFPNKLSEMEFTAEQRDLIRGARAEHKLNCMGAKKSLLAIVRSKSIETVGHRTNKKETMGTIRYAKREVVTDSFIYGAKPKTA